MEKRLFGMLAKCGAVFTVVASGMLSGCGGDSAVEHDTSRSYYLPYAYGRSFGVVQGSFTSGPPFSHQNEISYDFKMMAGTVILAARSGEVTDVVKKYTDACTDGRCPNNLIRILHNDSSEGGDSSEGLYLHLQQDGACVSVGDKVKQGDIIGLSGDVGRSALAHLHFQILPGPTQTLPDPNGVALATDTPRSFVDVEGDGIPGGIIFSPRYYTSANMPNYDWCAANGVKIPDQDSSLHRAIAQDSLCLEAGASAVVGDGIDIVSGCLGGSGEPESNAARRWIHTDDGQIRSVYGLCISMGSTGPELQACTSDDAQKWTNDEASFRVRSVLTGECLDFASGNGGALGMSACDAADDRQRLEIKDV